MTGEDEYMCQRYDHGRVSTSVFRPQIERSDQGEQQLHRYDFNRDAVFSEQAVTAKSRVPKEAPAGRHGGCRGKKGERRSRRDDAEEHGRPPVARLPAPRFSGVAQIQHHDDEKKQDHDGAGVDDDLENRHQGGAEQVEDDGKGEERGNEVDDGMHRVLFGDGENRCDNGDGGEDVEDCRFQRSLPVLKP